MNRDEILKINKHYWDTCADLWFGATALPAYGVHFVTEDELHLFGYGRGYGGYGYGERNAKGSKSSRHHTEEANGRKEN